MKKKGIIAFLFLFFCLFLNPVWAKYELEESIMVATIQIDQTPPSLEVQYSTKELTEGKVEVILLANEKIQNKEGWILEKDEKTLRKEYLENTEEEIEILDLAGNISKVKVEIKNIDRQDPKIEIREVINSNREYPDYANKEAEITFMVAIQDDRKIEKCLQEEDIRVLVGTKEINPKQKTITIKKDTDQEKEILVKLVGIVEEGMLNIQIPAEVVQDEIGHSNIAVEKETNIHIDNTNPEAIYSQNKIEKGKVEVNITAQEEIRKLKGWELENQKVLKKVFQNNLSYTTAIQDLAGNITKVEIDIKEASNISISYASHNSMVGWSYGYGNYDIAGLDAIKRNPKYKIESLAFSIEGEIEKDYLQARAFVYTHWGEGSKAKCQSSGKIYSYGWNPENKEWMYENEETKINLEEKSYFQLGGTGINGEYNTDINGNGSITPQITRQFRYGISALELKLKSYEENSICYQVYIDSVGWLKPAKNGERTCHQITKPFSAIRIAFVPNSEVEAVMSTWNQDTGKKL